jgi:hypothetical protein
MIGGTSSRIGDSPGTIFDGYHIGEAELVNAAANVGIGNCAVQKNRNFGGISVIRRLLGDAQRQGLRWPKVIANYGAIIVSASHDTRNLRIGLLRQTSGEQWACPNNWAGDCTAPGVSKFYVERESYQAVFSGRGFQSANLNLGQRECGLMGLRRHDGGMLLRLGGPDFGGGCTLDGVSLGRNGFGLALNFLELPLRTLSEILTGNRLSLHLIDFGGQSIRLTLDLSELAAQGVRFPLSLGCESRDIGDGVFNVARISGDNQSEDRDYESSQRNKGIHQVENANFFPQRLIAWLALIVGAGTFVTGWLWITVAVRRNLTIGQAGWRGAVAVALIASGIVAVWQSVPLVLPF